MSVSNANPPMRSAKPSALNRLAVLSVLLLAAITRMPAQTFPFPQHVTYAAGIKPTNVTQSSMDSTVASFWNTWKGRYLKTASTGGYYVAYNIEGQGEAGAATVSEAHGYGMVLVAYMAGSDTNAKLYFDGLYT